MFKQCGMKLGQGRCKSNSRSTEVGRCLWHGGRSRPPTNTFPDFLCLRFSCSLEWHHQPALGSLGKRYLLSLLQKQLPYCQLLSLLPISPLLALLCVSVHPHKQPGKETRANTSWDMKKRIRQLLFCRDEAGLAQCLIIK